MILVHETVVNISRAVSECCRCGKGFMW